MIKVFGEEGFVLELCCFECLQNNTPVNISSKPVLELCCFECLQNSLRRSAGRVGGFRAMLF